jgi:hypothetical protein
MASFEEILKRPASEFRAPEPLPVGVYHCMIDGPPEVAESKNQNKYFRFKFKILAPFRGVDAQKAAEMQVVGKTVTCDYYVTDNATFRLSEMLVDHLGLEETTPIDQLVAQAPGQQILVELKHEASQDGKRVFHRVHSTAHV